MAPPWGVRARFDLVGVMASRKLACIWRRLTTVLLIALLTHPGLAALEPAPVSVSVQRLSALAIYPEFSAPATVLSINDSRISAELRGRILEILAEVGDSVIPEQVLVRLDCRDFELEAGRLEAELKGLAVRIVLARKQLKRAQSLQDGRNVSEELLNQRQAELDGALAERDVVRIRLAAARIASERCVIRAPYAGVVQERFADVGELAEPGTPLLRLLDTQHLEVSAQVLANRVPRFSEARDIRFEHQGRRYPVVVRRAVPVINTSGRNQEVRLRFTIDRAPPGAPGRLIWQDSGPYMPAELVVRRAGRLGVFVTEAETARFVPLPGAQEGRPVRVDLPPDAWIVTDGRYLLEDGSAVRQDLH